MSAARQRGTEGEAFSVGLPLSLSELWADIGWAWRVITVIALGTLVRFLAGAW